MNFKKDLKEALRKLNVEFSDELNLAKIRKEEIEKSQQHRKNILSVFLERTKEEK